MAKVSFYYNDVQFTFKQRNALKGFIEQLFVKEKIKLTELTYIFCTDDYLLNINRSALNHDYYTDIITFDLSNDDSFTIGEIYISIDRVKDNANQLAIPFNQELHRVIFHGALHLCGYEDKSKADIVKMRSMEDKYLATYFK